jgi:DNA-binding transcriptional LysR family regulator
MLPELRHLHALVALERHGSITAAARALGYSQPAVSRQLRYAEAVIGEPLLRRIGRRAALTERGRELARAAEIAFAALGADRAILSSWPHDHSRVPRDQTTSASPHDDLGADRIAPDPAVALLAPESLFVWLVPDLLRRLAPGDRDAVRLETGADPLVAERLLAGDLDLAIVTGLDSAAAPRGLRAIRLLREPMLLALPPSHPAARDGSVALRALAKDRWIDGPHPDCLGHFTRLRLERPALQVGSGAVKSALLRGGAGVSCWPAASRPAAGGLALRRMQERPITRRLDLLLRRRDEDHPGTRRLLVALDGALRARPGGVGQRLL